MGRAIDVQHLGRDRVICAYEVEGMIVDPGPSTGMDALLAGLEGVEPRALLLTHVHLDHAGASGSLVERFPDLEVYVHEIGAPHMIDPEKLLRSATKLYGEDMDRLWGEVVPVPERNVRVLRGGEIVDGFRVEYTPGHASHHVTYLHGETNTAYVGDVAGVRIPPLDYVLPPTPPPDIDLAAWEQSIQLLEDLGPERLCLTHFGEVRDVHGHLRRLREGLARQGERARAHGREPFVAALEDEIRELGSDADGHAERFFQAAPPEQLYLGLERYWRKQADAGGDRSLTRAPASRP